ncbi:MAG TPA: hypothetical protein PLO51_02480 [Candidatus Micrarchaeota archaeon]|nr:hypothetical protein [Candidatus Micrarchaeota archaeon]
MDWKSAISEGSIIYRRHWQEHLRLALIFVIGSMMAFGAPFSIAVAVFALTIGLSVPDSIAVPVNIFFVALAFVLGVIAYASMKAAYYAGVFEIYNRGSAHALNYFSFARRHMKEAAVCEAIICLGPMVVAAPVAIAGIILRSELLLFAAAGIFLVLVTATNYFSMLAYPALIIDGYGSVAAIKKSMKTEEENRREMPAFFAFVWICLLVLLAIPVLGLILYSLVFLPIIATAATVFYRSKRKL